MATDPHLTLPSILAPGRRDAAIDQPRDVESGAPDPGAYRAPALSPDGSHGDNQAYAAAELVRLGFATRVTLVNASLDDALPESWEIRGTPVGLVRLPASRSRLTAGPPRGSARH